MLRFPLPGQCVCLVAEGEVGEVAKLLRAICMVLVDSDLSLNDHISSIVRACFYDARGRLLSPVRPGLTRKAASVLTVTLVLLKWDY